MCKSCENRMIGRRGFLAMAGVGLGLAAAGRYDLDDGKVEVFA